nr:MAG TPA_asm: hypothetical protein [Caudoviricetes sp.]
MIKIIIFFKLVSNFFKSIICFWSTVDKIFDSFSIRSFCVRISIKYINSVFVIFFSSFSSCYFSIQINCNRIISSFSYCSLFIYIALKGCFCSSGSSNLIMKRILNSIILRFSCRSFCCN